MLRRIQLMVRWVLWVFVVWVTLPLAHAEGLWRFSRFLQSDGTPYAVVRDIVEDASGAIWIATWGGGLHQIDGTEQRSFHESDGLPSNWVSSLADDERGGLWIGTREGLVLYRNGEFRLFGPGDIPGVRGTDFSSVRLLDSDTLCAAVEGGDIALLDLNASPFEAGAWSVSKVPRAARVHRPIDVVRLSDGRLFASFNSSGVFAFNGTVWDVILSNYRGRLIEGPAGKETSYVLAFGRLEGAVRKYDGVSWEKEPAVGEPVVTVMYSPDGVLYAGTQNGVSVLTNGTWRSVDLGNDVGTTRVRAICFSRNGHLWLGTETGVVLGKRPPWRGNHQTVDGVTVQRIVNDPEHRRPLLGIDEKNRLLEWKGGVWRPLFELANLEASRSWWVLPPYDSLWGLQKKRVLEFSLEDGALLRSLEYPDSETRPVAPLLRNSKGELWISTVNGVYALVEGDWIPIPRDPSYIRKTTYSVLEIGEDEYYVGVESGVEHWKDGIVIEIALIDRGEPVAVIGGIHPRPNENDYLVGTYGHGVQVFDGDSTRPFDEQGRFNSAQVMDIHEAADGTLWVAFRHSGVASFRDGFWRTYYQNAGLAGTRVTGIHEDPDGMIWLSTNRGGIFSYERTHEPPETYIDAAASSLLSREVGIFTFSARDAWDITLKEHLLYSWRVTSASPGEFETPWSTYGSRTTAVTPKLPSGNFVFEVRASDDERSFDATPASVTFRVVPPFWQTPGFLASVAVLGLLVLLAASVTGRALARRRIAEKEQRDLALFAELDPSPEIRVDRTGRILSSNAATMDVLGTFARKGTKLQLVVPSLFDVDFDACCVAGQELTRIAEIGERRYQFDIVGVPALDLVHVYTRDITELKRAEEEARIRQEQLLQADKLAALGRLVAGVAHEINNPNTYVKANAELFTKSWDHIAVVLDKYYDEYGDFSVGGMPYSEFREEAPELFSGILDGSERIRSIVQELRDFARVSPSSVLESVAANEVILTATTLLSNMLKKSTNHLSLDLLEDLPKVHGNFQHLEQVLINVLQNACQALPDPESGIFVSTAYDREANRVLIIVRDEGEGIDKDALTHVTEPFFTTKRDSSGLGLGMSISSSIIEDHGGTLEFSSVVGEGTTVTIRLPAVQPVEGD